MTSLSTDHAAATYDAMAPFYDVVSQGDNYSAFGDVLQTLIDRVGPPGKRLLDAGCGTGRSTLVFAEHGYDATGFDISAEMIREGREKHADRGIDLHVHDITQPFPTGGPYDVVVGMSDIFNYLIDPRHVAEALASLGSVMRPGAVLVFDANTRHGYGLMTSTHVYEYEGLYATMRGRFQTDGDPQRFTMTMNAFRNSAEEPDRWSRERIDHFQRHHTRAEFADHLDAAGLDLVAAHGLTRDGTVSDEVDDEAHTKGLYLAVRRSAG